LDINGGLVPIIELPDDRFVVESFGISEWVQDFSNEGVNLYPGDELNKDRLKEAVGKLYKIAVKVIIAFYKKEERDGEGDKNFVEGLEALNQELEKSDTDYFLHQEHETMADLMTFPFVHRAFLTEGSSLKEKYYDKINFSKIEKLKKWYDTLYEKYEDCTGKQEDFNEHLQKSIEADGIKVQLYYPLPSGS
jgi:glutathione S-transferase